MQKCRCIVLTQSKDHIPNLILSRKWKILAAECVFALILCIIAVIIAKPEFLISLEAEPTSPISLSALFGEKFPNGTILGSAPSDQPFRKIMRRAAELLGTEIIEAPNEKKLNDRLYYLTQDTPGIKKVIWVLWKPKAEKEYIYRYTIRSTELGRFLQERSDKDKVRFNPHLRAGFVSVECAVNHALLEHTAAPGVYVNYDLSLMAMPVSPLMEADKVARAVSLILMCYTLALLPPVLETESLVVKETNNRFKRALIIRSVDYSTIYLGWLTYALFTALPICLIGSTALIVIFRWIHLMYALITLLSYFSIMMVLAFIMSMFQESALISAVWTVSQTLLQTFLAELIVHHRKNDDSTGILTFILKSIIPPLGLLNGFNQFALLRTGSQKSAADSMAYTIMSWSLLLFLYFMLLMLLQRTIGSEKAIGGQVSWKSIIFKRAKDPDKLRPVLNHTDTRSERLQEVDELVAKAASFSDVSKSIMGVPHLTNVTFSIYRGEYSIIFSERIQAATTTCVEDLLTGLTYADSGTINVLGVELVPGRNLLTEPMMTGYCDRSSILIDDLTVEEHLHFYTEICLWHEMSDSVLEFVVIRHKDLKKECDLDDVFNIRVEDLSMYHRAQLCWAIAILLEPRLVIIPEYSEKPIFKAVIKDKILTNRTFLTIVSLTVSSIELQHADRLFLLDNRVLAFGGTPAYMFYKYGRDYRIRINFFTSTAELSLIEELSSQLHDNYGANVRAQLGYLLILRMPTEPSAKVASLIEYVENNTERFHVRSVFVSLPDPEEVFRRAIHESREKSSSNDDENENAMAAIEQLRKKSTWKLRTTYFTTFLHLRAITWKYFTCYIHYRFLFILTLFLAITAGCLIGYDLGKTLKSVENDEYNSAKQSNLLTVEATKGNTILVIRVDNSKTTFKIGSAYVLSYANSTYAEGNKILYISLVYPESLTEYLATRAVDSPRQYVHMYAYGLDVHIRDNGVLKVRVLYSPLHKDQATAPRSIARAYMALMRFYSGHIEAAILIKDSPLILSNPLLVEPSLPLLVQFFLVLTTSHIALVPSKEHGHVRHMQKHAHNFSPFRYWVNLAVCDIILYWMLVLIISGVVFGVLFFLGLRSIIQYSNLLAIPFMLMVYGLACVPQGYLFSLGPSAPLNTMALIITNIVFGEATLLTKLFYGGAVYKYAIWFMALSPQYNMAYALVKITQIFIYNTECTIYETGHMCANKMLHKCCEKCGVLEECFKRRSCISAIQTEVRACLVTATLMFIVLLLWEYRLINMVLNMVWKKILGSRQDNTVIESPGLIAAKKRVIKKEKQLKNKDKSDSFGENLLIVDASRVEHDLYIMRHVYIGLSKGGALAIAGLKVHGRVKLCEMIAGFKTNNEGQFWAVSKYRLRYSPHKYATQVAYCCERNPLPEWMTVYDGLELLAIMRGVPVKHIKSELENYINALDLKQQEDLQICHLLPSERYRLHFAAAVVGAPPILVFNDCTAYQCLAVRRSMYAILSLLRKRGHSIVHSGFSLESHMPVTSYLAIVRDGRLFELDNMHVLQERYGGLGYTVVVHLKDEVDIDHMFHAYFYDFVVNDTSDVLVNVQILDSDLTWAGVFNKMEQLKMDNPRVYSYIICTKSIDYVYQNIISEESGLAFADEYLTKAWFKKCFALRKKMIRSPIEKIQALKGYQKMYNLTKLNALPWTEISTTRQAQSLTTFVNELNVRVLGSPESCLLSDNQMIQPAMSNINQTEQSDKEIITSSHFELRQIESKVQCCAL